MQPNPTYPHHDLTRRIIGAFYDVYNELGSGFREIVYARAMQIALTELGLRSEREVPTAVFFRGQSVGTFRADLIVEQTVLLELKALPDFEPSHIAQVINVLRATDLTVGLLLNFGPKPQVKRLIRGDHRCRR